MSMSKNGNIHLTLVPTDESNSESLLFLKKYEPLWTKIRDLS